MKRNSRRTGIFLFALIAGILFFSCAQDSIFYLISTEEKPITALIDGSPTNIIVLGDKVFAGSRMGKSIYCYSNGIWKEDLITLNADSKTYNLIELATDNEYLYALVMDGNSITNTEILRISKNDIYGNWTKLVKPAPAESAASYSMDTMFGAGGKIFVGGKAGNEGAILYIGSDGIITAVKTSDLTLQITDTIISPATFGGVAVDGSGDYYLAAGNGVYRIPAAEMATGETIKTALAAVPMSNTEERNFVGLQAIPDNLGGVTVVAISRDKFGYGYIHILQYNDTGAFFDVPTDSVKVKSGATEVSVGLSGAMGVWRKYDGNEWKSSLLLLGVSSIDTTHGYVELVLDAYGKPASGSKIKSPDEREEAGFIAPNSMHEPDKYQQNIGKHAIMAILQLPDTVVDYSRRTLNENWQPPLFASTSSNGLWSYRERAGQWSWNAENRD